MPAASSVITQASSDPADPAWHWLYRLGAVAAIINVLIIPIQIIVFMVSPPPEQVADWFAHLIANPLMALLNLDLLYLLNNALLIVIYLALFVALRSLHRSAIWVALATGLVGIAAYFPTNTAFEMLALSQQYTTADAAQQAILLGAGQALTIKYLGTSFIAYYLLNAVALLLFAWVMLRSPHFSKAAAYAGLIAGVLMLVPTPFGTIGLLFGFVSLLPWSVFSILITRSFMKLSQSA